MKGMVSARISELPFGVWHIRFLLIMATAWGFDAMDTGIISFVLPKLMTEWRIGTTEIGYIGSAGLAGMAVGAAVSGMLADRIGRKGVLVSLIILCGLASVACGLAVNYEMLLICRFIVGVGLGGQLPVAVTLVSEYAPASHRGRMIVWLESAWAFGWLAAAGISYFVIPAYGWEVAFYVSALPVLWAFYMMKAIPESVLFLQRKGRMKDAEAILEEMERNLGVACGEESSPSGSRGDNSSDASEHVGENFTLATLFSRTYIRRTLCLWVLWFGLVFSYYGIFMWLPTLLVKAGFTMVTSFTFVFWMTAAQIPGYAAAAILIDRIGRKITLVSFLFGCAVAAYFFGHATSETEILLWGCLMSFFNLGAWGIIYTYTPELYPTAGRATGSGWAGACGRIGGMAAPPVVGILFGGPEDFSTVFAVFTGVLCLIGLNVWLFGPETMHERLKS